MNHKLLLGIAAAVVVTIGVIALLNDYEPVAASDPRTGAAPPASSASPAAGQPPVGQVVINGRALSAAQILELEQLYRAKLQPGNFWYDTVSGLFGVVGQPAAGFLHPGHDLGPLAANASAGNTGVFINGREQTAREVQILSVLAGTQVVPGRYWLDAQGNAGYEGNPMPVGNLFTAALAAQQSGGGAMGGGGGGDNFWFTRFSAGNYNADNSAGYVSLPNGGFVSYGD